MKKLLSALAVSAALTVSGCGTVAEVAGFNTQALNADAAKSYAKVVGEAQGKKTVDTTSRTARRIQTVFNNMKPYAERANKTGVPFDWQMTVIKSDELNAWAMPGGKMAFYTGLADKLKLTDDEIAAIVGHEMTHALEEHSKKDAGQKVLTGLAVQLGGAALQGYTGWSADTVGLAAGILSEYGVDKPFSRHQEYDADAGGLFLMAEAGYNPEAALSVWRKMNQENNNNNMLLTMLSTHPSNNARLEAMQKLLPQAMEIYQRSKRK
ncbi:MAG: M48 family metallopeptidase [Neisseria sp.]|nr:M48 family metallopeptidase [Neisseria sp.]